MGGRLAEIFALGAIVLREILSGKWKIAQSHQFDPVRFDAL
jgi:hypothetical protein